jgi:hypothetical protein
LFDVIAIDESLGRMQPNRPIVQRRKGLFVVLVLESAALTGSG